MWYGLYHFDWCIIVTQCKPVLYNLEITQISTWEIHKSGDMFSRDTVIHDEPKVTMFSLFPPRKTNMTIRKTNHLKMYLLFKMVKISSNRHVSFQGGRVTTTICIPKNLHPFFFPPARSDGTIGGCSAWRIIPLRKWLGSPPFTSHEKAIWKGSHNPT